MVSCGKLRWLLVRVWAHLISPYGIRLVLTTDVVVMAPLLAEWSWYTVNIRSCLFTGETVLRRGIAPACRYHHQRCRSSTTWQRPTAQPLLQALLAARQKVARSSDWFYTQKWTTVMGKLFYLSRFCEHVQDLIGQTWDVWLHIVVFINKCFCHQSSPAIVHYLRQGKVR